MTPEQRASQALFGMIDFDHQEVDGPYSLDGKEVLYSQLVALYRAEDAGSKPMDFASARVAASRILDCMDQNLTMFDACCDEVPQVARDLYDAAKKLHDLLGVAK